MTKELNGRVDTIKVEIENVNKLPEQIAIRKGQLMQNTSDTESRKQELSTNFLEAEENYKKKQISSK